MFRIALAEHEFLINNRFRYVEKLCRDYIVPMSGAAGENNADIISASQKEIEFENKAGSVSDGGYLEALAIHRKISERLLNSDILLFHGSAVALGGRAYLFAGESGSGKSTCRRLWQERFGGALTVINDDKPFLAFRQAEIIVYGSPWAGKESLQRNTNAVLRGIVFIKQAGQNSLRPLSEREAFPRLLNQIYRVGEPGGIVKTLDLGKRLAGLPVYELSCTISQEAVALAYNALKTAGTGDY